jgi:hypothetical protein
VPFIPGVKHYPDLALLPLALYALAVLGQTAFIASRSGLRLALYSLPLLVASTLLYGFGLLWGLIKPIPRPPPAPEHDIRFEYIPVAPR